jgi:hypothetical protein
MDRIHKKENGAYYTPDHVVRSLVKWAVRSPGDRLLDPACGDGRFLMPHANSVGVEQDPEAARQVHQRVPGSLIHQGDFFAWAAQTRERFDCAAGNPPFIRYQRFRGPIRQQALSLCARHGASFSSLTSSWAPFLVATATVLKPGGRMAFVVPAEFGHAPYSRPLIEYLAGHFEKVQVIAFRERLFEELSEDCWLLTAYGFGASTEHILISSLERFAFNSVPPRLSKQVSLFEWRTWNCRLRPFLLSGKILDLYRDALNDLGTRRLGELARVGIGYVTGDNAFFHLRPSVAQQWQIPDSFLHPTIRSGRMLDRASITADRLDAWRRSDEPNFLLRIRKDDEVPPAVRKYLDSEGGQRARRSYKCRHREPWYAVPDVTVPDGFLSYMTGSSPTLVVNDAGCTGTNSIHMITLASGVSVTEIQRLWSRPLTRLSCEIEGHPLGGGMLKLEPREAGRVALSKRKFESPDEASLIDEGIRTLRQWRHCA